MVADRQASPTQSQRGHEGAVVGGFLAKINDVCHALLAQASVAAFVEDRAEVEPWRDAVDADVPGAATEQP